MGQVFRAMDTDEGWHVAVKVLPKKFATPDAVRRFEREGQTSLRVQHPNIVRTMEIGLQGSTYFLVMEMVIGTDLAKIIRQSGKLSVGQTARVGYDVALGLEHARQLGVVHRDVKPSNILIAADGTAKLTDLGLAKFFGGSDEAASLTNTGAVLGTVDYISPEQAEDAKRADTRSDVYSLGCTLYHCLTGRAPFADGTTFQRLLAHREEDAEPISTWNPDVPRELDELIVKKMMAKARGLRLQTPAEVAAALEPWARSAAGTRPLAPIPAAAASDAESDSGSPSTQTDDAAADSAKKYITAVCPVCGTRMAATHDQAGTKIECPDCNTKVPVPWPSARVDAPQPVPEPLSSYDIAPAMTRPPVPAGEFVAAASGGAATDAAQSFIPDREVPRAPAPSAPLVDLSPRKVRKILGAAIIILLLTVLLAGATAVIFGFRRVLPSTPNPSAPAAPQSSPGTEQAPRANSSARSRTGSLTVAFARNSRRQERSYGT
jgi:serine/threonine protein kinase